MKTIGLVQINNSFSGQSYLPYAAGLLEGYVKEYAKKPDAYNFLDPVYKREPVKDIKEKLRSADLVGFSTYVWNINISLKVAEELKLDNPDIFIVFGGPQVPDNAEEFLRKHEFIDVVCHGEGEQVFLNIIENYENNNWNDIFSISLLTDSNEFINTQRAPRFNDINVIPSPYLTGAFERTIQSNPDESWLAMWETNRGCPFECTFCDWGSAVAAKVTKFDIERIYKEVDYFSRLKIEFVFCCDGNFGMLPRDLDIVKYVAKVKEQKGFPHALSVQNTKNATEKSYVVQKQLSDAGLNKGVAISLQSIHPDTLVDIKRENISLESFFEIHRRFKKDNVDTYTDLILGLPGETYDSYVDGISVVIERGQHNRIQFNNLSILPNSEMGDPEYIKKHGLITVETRIDNIHGSLDDILDEVPERQVLVVGTKAMPEEVWIKARVFSWYTGLYYFNKVAQVPLLLIYKLYGVRFRDLIQALMDVGADSFPILNMVKKFLMSKALEIQKGGSEYCLSEDWLNIAWPADEFLLIKMNIDKNLDKFYSESEECLKVMLDDRGVEYDSAILSEAFKLNSCLLKQPFISNDLNVNLRHNIFECYINALSGLDVNVEKVTSNYLIDRTSDKWNSWAEWCKYVMWYGNKKGAYLYSASRLP